MMIAGVGGQGVVYLTNLMVEAALIVGIPVATSEIHGLSQRGGSVTAGITFGENSYGFIEKGGADFIIGLEPLEAQRSLPFLSPKSQVIIDDKQVYPFSVNSGKAVYPDVMAFVEFLKDKIAQVIYNSEFDSNLNSLHRNLYILGKATKLDGFPLPLDSLEGAIVEMSNSRLRDESVRVFRLGVYGD
jgi:indolepyruvate ferredoxin oxidoreductase beta subunit